MCWDFVSKANHHPPILKTDASNTLSWHPHDWFWWECSKCLHAQYLNRNPEFHFLFCASLIAWWIPNSQTWSTIIQASLIAGFTQIVGLEKHLNVVLAGWLQTMQINDLSKTPTELRENMAVQSPELGKPTSITNTLMAWKTLTKH